MSLLILFNQGSSAPVTITCLVGDAAANGIASAITVVVSAAVGDSTAAGVTAAITATPSVPTVIAALVGSAVADGALSNIAAKDAAPSSGNTDDDTDVSRNVVAIENDEAFQIAMALIMSGILETA